MPRTTTVADAPFVLVGNPGSGTGRRREAVDAVRAVLGAHRRPFVQLQPAEPSELPALARRAVRLAAAHGGCVVAAGGDGTVATVAQAWLDHERERERERDGDGRGGGSDGDRARGHADARVRSPAGFGVLPLGTFNYFARTHRLPEDPAQAARSWVAGRLRPVQAARVGDRVFLVNASLGLYPQLLLDREALSRQLGRRSRALALLSLLRGVLGRDVRLDLAVSRDGEPLRLRATTLFVGNNRLQLEQVGSTQADAVDDGRLAMLWLRQVPALHRLWVALRGAAGDVGGADAVVEDRFHTLTVTPAGRRGRPMPVAVDGEVTSLVPPLVITVEPRPLPLLVPPADEDRDDGAAAEPVVRLVDRVPVTPA